MRLTSCSILPALIVFLISSLAPGVASGQWTTIELLAVSEITATQTINTSDPGGASGWTMGIACDFDQGECDITVVQTGATMPTSFTGVVSVDDDQTALIQLDGELFSGELVAIDGMAKRDCCPAPTGGAGEVAGTVWVGMDFAFDGATENFASVDSDSDIFANQIKGVQHTGLRQGTANFDGGGDFLRKGMSASNLACKRSVCTYTYQENFFGAGGTPLGERNGSGTSDGDLADAIFTINALFAGGPTTPP